MLVTSNHPRARPVLKFPVRLLPELYSIRFGPVTSTNQLPDYLTIIRLCLGKYINNSLYLARKYAGIFVRGHYLFREANSFPRV